MTVKFDVGDLAMILAASTEVGFLPRSREDIVGIWLQKGVSVQYAYRLRAQRLLNAWVGAKRAGATPKEIA